MQIKSKYELNFVHIAVLAVCSLFAVNLTLNEGLTILLISAISYILSLFICMVAFKKVSRNSQIFITAIITALVILFYQILVENKYLAGMGELVYFSILPTLILSIDSFYLDSKSANTNYFLKIVRLLFVYSFVLILYVSAKELLAFGTINGQKPFKFDGYPFFETVTFDFLLLGLVCAVINRISNLIVELYNEKVMILNKYKTKVRNEKTFLYDYYRRKKLLTSDVITNKVSGGDELYEEVVEVSDEPKSSGGTTGKPKKSVIKHKPRKVSKLKVSKEAKVEQMFSNKKDGNKGGKK